MYQEIFELRKAVQSNPHNYYYDNVVRPMIEAVEESYRNDLRDLGLSISSIAEYMLYHHPSIMNELEIEFPWLIGYKESVLESAQNSLERLPEEIQEEIKMMIANTDSDRKKTTKVFFIQDQEKE